MEPKPAVMVLGMVHTANPGRDLVNKEFDDVLAAQRQREFDACIEKLARFQPTKIAVEWSFNEQDILDREYQVYLENAGSSNRNEIHQVGFRLAAKLKHPCLYAVDSHDQEGLDIHDVYHWAQDHQPALHHELMTEMQALSSEFLDPSSQSLSILDLLRAVNKPRRALREQQWYMGLFSLIGHGSEYHGIDWMTGWYRRNMMIYVNVTRLVTAPEDRILVLFGAGHQYLLQQFFRESGRFVVDSAQTYFI